MMITKILNREIFRSFLKSVLLDENYSFNEFSNITDIKCKIHYAFSLNNLKNLGHFYPKEELFLKQLLKLQNKFLIKKVIFGREKKKLEK